MSYAVGVRLRDGGGAVLTITGLRTLPEAHRERTAIDADLTAAGRAGDAESFVLTDARDFDDALDLLGLAP